MNRLCAGKSLVQTSSTKCQKPRSNKNCILRILLSQKCYWRFSHVFLPSKDDSNHWNKKRTGKTFWKAVLSVARSSIKLFQKLSRKNGACNGVWSVWEEHTSSNLHVPFRFAVKIDRNQIMDSDFSTKCRKRSQRKSLSFWLVQLLPDCIFRILTSSVSVNIKFAHLLTFWGRRKFFRKNKVVL